MKNAKYGLPSSERQRSSSKSPSRSPNSRVSKRGTPCKSSIPRSPLQIESLLSSKPSEEDLFYLLIHKLKKREETQAAATALKEEMENKLHNVKEENETLRSRLQQAELHNKSQEAEKVSQRGFIKRWKVKFGKLRNLVRDIGHDQETLRREGQRLKSTQTALTEEGHQLMENVKQLNNGTDQARKFLSKHKAQLSGMQNEFNSLEECVRMTNLKSSEESKALAREQNRTATLESFIRSSSDKTLRQMTLLQQNQAETISRIQSTHDQINASLANSHAIIKSDLEPPLTSCLEMLKSVNSREFVEPAQLAQVDASIQDVSSRYGTPEFPCQCAYYFIG